MKAPPMHIEWFGLQYKHVFKINYNNSHYVMNKQHSLALTTPHSLSYRTD